MEDTIIKPGHYAFQFRIDLLDNKNERIFINPDYAPDEKININDVTATKLEYREILKVMLEVHFSYYFIFVECGGDTGKVHLQGVIWSKHNYHNKFLNSLKSKYFFRHRTVKNSLSITNAKRITNLCSYVAKDGDAFMSNLTDEDVSKFPDWIKRESVNKKEFKKQLIARIEIEIEKDSSPRQIALMIIEEYWNNRMRQPARMDIIKYLGWYHPEYTPSDYLNNINIFPSNNYLSY